MNPLVGFPKGDWALSDQGAAVVEWDTIKAKILALPEHQRAGFILDLVEGATGEKLREEPADGCPADVSLPLHLSDDAVSMACNICGRKTWIEERRAFFCYMTQPNGEICKGKFE